MTAKQTTNKFTVKCINPPQEPLISKYETFNLLDYHFILYYTISIKSHTKKAPVTSLLRFRNITKQSFATFLSFPSLKHFPSIRETPPPSGKKEPSSSDPLLIEEGCKVDHLRRRFTMCDVWDPEMSGGDLVSRQEQGGAELMDKREG
ncbi:hypothetical protein TNCT_538481 [Trichonephila clavata]|uniref:Uncharacterized protein n=1 Tax=Trichonephila clavata TaxID=2740835 RepID=A0A8X6GXB5_TRICU|nr:hypothetical protein TNCT_538481 [Trichonephila clavata]